jgi:hypothetical protein
MMNRSVLLIRILQLFLIEQGIYVTSYYIIQPLKLIAIMAVFDPAHRADLVQRFCFSCMSGNCVMAKVVEAI